MAEAYSDRGRTSFKYQFSVPPALHGGDVSGCTSLSLPFCPKSSQLTRMLQRLRSGGSQYRSRSSTRLPTDLGQFHNNEQPKHFLKCCKWCFFRECSFVERRKQLATIHNLCTIPDQSERSRYPPLTALLTPALCNAGLTSTYRPEGHRSR